MSLVGLLPKLAQYRLSYRTGRPPTLPVNLTVSVTYACPSRCKTCDIWKKHVSDLSLDEYGRIFPSLRKVPIWVTVSGGDQFLRRDLPEIVGLIRTELEPNVINIPMNGIVTERIFTMLPRIASASRPSQLVLNLSVDEIGSAHDEIRGAPKNYDKLIEVARLIHDLKKTYDHVVLGVHTVVSRFNVQRIAEIEREARATFTPDSYIAEVAEHRVELDTMDKDISPSPADYRAAVACLRESMKKHGTRHPVARLVQSLRHEYYGLAARILEEQRQVVDCYAGWASAHLAPDGDLWGCCVRAEPLGNLRNEGYDFERVWLGHAANEFRRSVKAHECACPLANASYTNLLLDPRSLVRVTRNMVAMGA